MQDSKEYVKGFFKHHRCLKGLSKAWEKLCLLSKTSFSFTSPAQQYWCNRGSLQDWLGKMNFEGSFQPNAIIESASVRQQVLVDTVCPYTMLVINLDVKTAKNGTQ